VELKSSGFYREARVFIHAFFVPRQLQQVAAAFTRARVDPRVSASLSFQVSAGTVVLAVYSRLILLISNDNSMS
jgi:hypothetical protein